MSLSPVPDAVRRWVQVRMPFVALVGCSALLVLASPACHAHRKARPPALPDPPNLTTRASSAPWAAAGTGVDALPQRPPPFPAADPVPESPHELAAKTAAYAEQIEPLLQKHLQPAKNAQADWLDPHAFRLSATPPASSARIASPPQAPPRAAIPPADTRPAPTTVPAAAPPVPAAPAGWAEKLHQKVREDPGDLCAQLDYQLHQLIRDAAVPDLPIMASLPREDREILSALLDGLANFRNAARADGSLLHEAKTRPLLEMADRLRSQADLTIPTARLCTKVDGFGVYEPIDPPRLAAGRPHQVIIYCEVANFSSQLNARKLWETRLTQEAVLYTESGLAVWTDPSRPIVDLCRNRRSDFFIVRMMRLPANLNINRYLLKITVTDQQAGRIAEVTIPLDIVAQ